MSHQSTVYENELVDQTLTAMLWSRRAADIARTTLHISAFAGRAALVADHDHDHADSALEGVERVQSLVRSIIDRADDVQRARDDHDSWILARSNGPEPISPYCAAVSMHAYHAGAPDPLLLSRARHVLTYLPELVAPAGLQPSHGTITHLVHQLALLADQNAPHHDGLSPELGRSTKTRRIKSGSPLGSARQPRRRRISTCHPPTSHIAAYDDRLPGARAPQMQLDFC